MKQDDFDDHNLFWSPDDWVDEKTKKLNKEDLDKIFKPSDYCSHLWINYTGLNEVYQFCKLCNVKKLTK